MNAAYAPPDDRELGALVRQLSQAEEAVQAALGGQGDMVVDPGSGVTILLRQAQQALLESESYNRGLANILENVRNSVIVTDLAGRVTYWNDGAENLFGYTADEMLGQPMRALYEGQAAYDTYLRQIRAGQEYRAEWQARRKDGVLVWVDTRSRPMRDGVGPITGTIDVGEDISGRRRAEETLRQNERRFRALIENSADAITLIAADGTVVYDSPAAPGLLGYQPEELVGRNAFELIHSQDLAATQAVFKQVLSQPASPVPAMFRIQHKQGHWLWIEAVASNLLADPAVGAITINYRDVTERIQAALALSESEDKFKYVFDHSLIGKSLTLPSGELRVNKAFCEMVGYSQAELQEYAWNEITHPDDIELSQSVFASLLSGERDSARFTKRYVHKNGAIVWVDVNTFLRRDEAGQPLYFITAAVDITERKRAEEALAASEAELRALFAAMTDVVLVLDANGRYLQIAPTNPSLLVKPPAELLGRSLHDILPRADAENIQLHIRRALAERQPIQIEYSLQVGGVQVWFDATIAPMDERRVIWIARDVSQRKRRELELEAIVVVSTALRKASTQAGMLPIVLEHVTELLSVSGAALALRDEASEDLVVALGHGELVDLTGRRLPAGAGLSGQLLAISQPYVTTDASADPHFYQLLSVSEHLAIACVPLITSRHVLGVLWAGRTAPFTEAEVRVLSAIASIAASAIQRAALHEQTEQRLQRLVALREIDVAIMGSLDLRMTLEVILGHVNTQLNVAASDILLLNRGTNILEYAAGRGFHSLVIEQSRLRLGEGCAGRAALERRLVAVSDLLSEPNDFRRAAPLGSETFEALYCVPLIARGQVVGVLEVWQRTALTPDADWLDFLGTLAGQSAIAVADAWLFADLQRSNMDMLVAYDTTLEGWSAALDLRDKATEGHSQRVTDMTLRLARVLGVSEGELQNIQRGALLHDIGKMGIPDAILLKPGTLTDEEWVSMRQHPTLAYQLLSRIAFLRPALDIPYCHHEKWDGTGYPRGLKGEEIPFAARIFAVVDVWDALCSDRPYRIGWPEDKVRDYIRNQSGHHFDPQVAEAFLALGPVGQTRAGTP